jgi:hypothetical protein
MQKKTFKKIMTATLSVFMLLVLVLGIHIYVVTRVKPPSEHTRVMARVDFKQHLDQGDADKITAWLYQQKGVDHVLVNPKSQIAIFTYFPVRADANDIVQHLRSSLNYKNAERYILTASDLSKSCPVASTSFSYKVYNTIKHIF